MTRWILIIHQVMFGQLFNDSKNTHCGCFLHFVDKLDFESIKMPAGTATAASVGLAQPPLHCVHPGFSVQAFPPGVFVA